MKLSTASVLAFALAAVFGPVPGAHAQSAQIVAVVNGSVITSQDVDARTRLFAASAGLPQNPEVLARLKPQITNELIDQALQLQAIEKNQVVVPQARLVSALEQVGKANGLPPGGLRAKLASEGVPFSTLVSQFRIQLGWNGVLKKQLGPDLRPTPEDIAAEKRAMQREIGQTQYHIAEIFIPIDGPSDEANARHFADTVIRQLRAGAPFPVVAAQFSQTGSALTGGDRGWVQPDLLDPAVRAIVQRMPTGAISDPVRVAGGYEIVQQLGSRKFGEENQTLLHIRQVFLPFPTAFAGGQPTAAQLAVLSHANALRGSLHDCQAVAAANAAAGSAQPSDPGQINLAAVRPAAFQTLLGSLPIGRISEPLVSHQGVALVMVCSRETGRVGLPGDKEITELLVERRVSLESQRLMDTLHREAIIQRFPAAG